MPKTLVYITLILIGLAMVPPAIIARARTAKSEARRIHIIQDMDNQAKYRAQHANPMFADGRAMRPPVPGTVARGSVGDPHYDRGVAGGAWASSLPSQLTLSLDFLERGRERFEIYCTLCHGEAGFGDGIVHQRAMQLQNNPAISNGTIWVQPKSLHAPDIRDQPVGQVYNTITNGIRNMAGYASQVPTDDRWAIASYVKALQRSQNAKPGDIPASERMNLPVVDLVPKEEP